MSTDVEEAIEEELDLTEPNLWRVIFHNDDKTTMEFVIFLLIQVFRKSIEESTQIMLNVHTKGAAVVAIYPYEIAESKMNICMNTARENGFPFVVSIEEDE